MNMAVSKEDFPLLYFMVKGFSTSDVRNFIQMTLDFSLY